MFLKVSFIQSLYKNIFMATLVKFLYENDDSDVVYAFFPQLNYAKNIYGNKMKTSYAHYGQHGGCHIDYAKESKEAIKNDYDYLKTELEQIGYKLRVLNKN
jgi:hypothetical protein